MQAVSIRNLTHRCSFCGVAITPKEIAYEITGQSIDYIEREPGAISLILCEGCRDRLLHNISKDQGEAIMQRKLLEADGAAKPAQAIDTTYAKKEFLEDHPFGIDPPDGTGMGI